MNMNFQNYTCKSMGFGLYVLRERVTIIPRKKRKFQLFSPQDQNNEQINCLPKDERATNYLAIFFFFNTCYCCV